MSNKAPINCFNIHYDMSKVSSWSEIANKLNAAYSSAMWIPSSGPIRFKDTLGGYKTSYDIKTVMLAEDLTFTFSDSNCKTLSFYEVQSLDGGYYTLRYTHHSISDGKVTIPANTSIALSTWEVQVDEIQKYYRYGENGDTFGTIIPSGEKVSNSTNNISLLSTISSNTIQYNYPFFGTQSKKMAGVGGSYDVAKETSEYFVSNDVVNFANHFKSKNPMHFNYYPYILDEVVYDNVSDPNEYYLQFDDNQGEMILSREDGGVVRRWPCDQQNDMFLIFVQENDSSRGLTIDDCSDFDLQKRLVSSESAMPKNFNKLQQTCFNGSSGVPGPCYFSLTGSLNVKMTIPIKTTVYKLPFGNDRIGFSYKNINAFPTYCSVVTTENNWVKALLTYQSESKTSALEALTDFKWCSTQVSYLPHYRYLIGNNVYDICDGVWEGKINWYTQTYGLLDDWSNNLTVKITNSNNLFDTSINGSMKISSLPDKPSAKDDVFMTDIQDGKIYPSFIYMRLVWTPDENKPIVGVFPTGYTSFVSTGEPQTQSGTGWGTIDYDRTQVVYRSDTSTTWTSDNSSKLYQRIGYKNFDYPTYRIIITYWKKQR